jgi:hypothetical protein
MIDWRFLSVGVALAAMVSAQAAYAADEASPPAAPTGPLQGTLAPNGKTNGSQFCEIPSGFAPVSGTPSVFNRNGAGPALIQFEAVEYFANPKDYYFGGLATLKFTTANSGTVALDVPAYFRRNQSSNNWNPAPDLSIKFNSYKQVFDAATSKLTVSFNLAFQQGSQQGSPSACAFSVAGTYRNPG